MSRRLLLNLIPAMLLCALPCFAQSFPHDTTRCKSIDERTLTVPVDFKVTYGSGPLHAEWGGAYTITIRANGDVIKEKNAMGRKKPGQKMAVENMTTAPENIKHLYGKVIGCKFFELETRYWNPKIRDGGRQYLTVTAEGKTHDVTVYYWTVDGFQAVATLVEKITEEAKSKHQPQQQAMSAEKAEELVWALPEVKEMAAQITRDGAKPFTRVELSSDDSTQGTFEIYFGEDYKTHTIRRETFIVDKKTGTVSVYDVVSDETMPIDVWRKKK